jgi:hypothetical protein
MSYMPDYRAAVEIDFYPDVSEYPAACLFETGFTLPDGSKAQLYDNTCDGVVDLHFKWMQQVGVDGVLVQRFLGSTGDASFTTVSMRGWFLLYEAIVNVRSINIP